MDEKTIGMKRWQRVVILCIALLLLFSTMAMYMMIVVVGNSSADSTESQVAKIQSQLSVKQAALETAAQGWSDQYFDEFVQYKSEIRAYNATTANEEDVTVRDLKEGDGTELGEGDTNYLAYYIGFCADESIFDSSFNSTEEPTSLSAPISAKIGLIEGWNQGVIGMKLNGVREITIPGELAYGESQEICGGTNSPLKFIVLPLEDESISKIQDEITELTSKINAAAMQAN